MDPALRVGEGEDLGGRDLLAQDLHHLLGRVRRAGLILHLRTSTTLIGVDDPTLRRSVGEGARAVGMHWLVIVGPRGRIWGAGALEPSVVIQITRA
ncbi:hypothetical protein GCM10009827_044720 [Dactylosporangium maewongense]|uniref:Uncharacterized protein n=1 Tax=Dactylosporangium maewongense TaxID=634393 RepID=A0ABN2ARG9_9ACTN